MISDEKSDALKNQEIYIKEYIQKLERQKMRLEVESNELKSYIRF